MLISVIIPLYNKESTIVNTLNSVLSQEYQAFEIVVVDDGSTDNSIRYINENFADERIRIVHQPNQGVSVARNTGIDEANGEWIAFLDADDEWMPQYLKDVETVLLTYPNIGFILSGRYSQNILSRKRSSAVPIGYENKISEINFFENPHVFCHISASIIRADILKKNVTEWNRFVPGQKSNEDFTFLYRIALHTQCLYIGKPLVIYNGGVEGQATSLLRQGEKMRDNILMRNLVITEWFNTQKINKVCGVFMKYETRHTVLGLLKKREYESIHLLIESMNTDCRTFYGNAFERKLYITPWCNKLAIYFIYLTKVIWRLHQYPVAK